MTPQDPKVIPFVLLLLKFPFALGFQGEILKASHLYSPQEEGPRAVYSQQALKHREAGGSWISGSEICSQAPSLLSWQEVSQNNRSPPTMSERPFSLDFYCVGVALVGWRG